MPYEFTDYPPEPEPQPSSSRGARPPIKRIGTDVLDAPEHSSPSASAYKRPHISFWLGIVLLLVSVLALFLIGLASR